MGWYHGGLGWGGWLLMALSMAAFWALVAFAIVAVFRSSRNDRTPARRERDPVTILDERFARGEIDETEYHQRADILRTAASR